MEDTKPQSQYDDEIDLIELMQTVWAGKWAIICVVLLAVAGVVGAKFLLPKSDFIATTQIKPISSWKAEQYRAFNAHGFFEISPGLMQSLYIEQLEDRQVFENAIREHGLIDRLGFENEEEYNAAVIELAASIDILPPVNADGKEKGPSRRFWTVGLKYNDEQKWKAVLTEVDDRAQEVVKKALQSRFNTALLVAKQENSHQLEDLNIQISNLVSDYDRKILDRIAFLSEQAAIARKLGVSKNTIEAQRFGASNSMVTNVKTDTPFYLRGYEAIEKEIELIVARDNKKAFVEGLLELEQQKRALLQDKKLERAQQLFATTPVMSDKDFSAVTMKVAATEVVSKSKWLLILALSIVLSGMIGVIYVLIANAIRNRRVRS